MLTTLRAVWENMYAGLCANSGAQINQSLNELLVYYPELESFAVMTRDCRLIAGTDVNPLPDYIFTHLAAFVALAKELAGDIVGPTTQIVLWTYKGPLGLADLHPFETILVVIYRERPTKLSEANFRIGDVIQEWVARGEQS